MLNTSMTPSQWIKLMGSGLRQRRIMMNQERANYVESELKKWKEHYEVGFAEEYDVKLLLGLRHQLDETPDDRIKTKVDLINAINNLMRGLRLKPIQKEIYDVDMELIIDPGMDYTTYSLINHRKKRMYKEELRKDFSSQADRICQQIAQSNVKKVFIDTLGAGQGLSDHITEKSIRYGFRIDEKGYVHKVN